MKRVISHLKVSEVVDENKRDVSRLTRAFYQELINVYGLHIDVNVMDIEVLTIEVVDE